MKAEIVDKVKNAGVVGAGGAGFPTHIKVNADVDTVLVNGASCEPLLMSDPYLMEVETARMVKGLNVVLDSTGAKKGVICLKGKHKKALASVKEAVTNDTSGRLDFFELKDFYPAGDEQVLVREVLGKTIPEAGIPLQVGVVVSNVETLFNIASAMENKPLTHRYLTVTGEVANPMVVKVPVGSTASQVLEFAGGPIISDFKVVDGGPMMGKVLSDLNQPVTKTTSGLIVLPSNHNVVARKTMDSKVLRRLTNTICCQCTQCTDLCPRNLLGHSLHPHKLMRILESDGITSEVAKEALLCSECGICEKFACPMLLSPREVNVQIKQALVKKGIRWQADGKIPVNHPYRDTRYVPTNRLMQRLNITQYDTHPEFSIKEFCPEFVTIPLQQHIGAPAVCVVKEGDSVKAGTLIGEIPEKALGARIHAGIDGQVVKIADGVVTIKKEV